MKFRSSFCALALACVCAIPVRPALAQGGGGGLLAAAYPGAVAQPYPKEGGGAWEMVPLSSRLQEFLSKDPPAKVKAFYEKTVGTFTVSERDGNAWYGEVIPGRDVIATLGKRGYAFGEAGGEFTRGTAAGVTIYGDMIQGNSNVTRVLEALKSAHVMKFNEEDPASVARHLEDPEMKEAIARYEPLALRWYLTEDGKGADLRAYETYYVDAPAARQKELADITKRMQDLTMQQKYDEASRLGDRIMKITMHAMDGTALWAEAVACLQEMERAAYRTKIVIDKHPSGWDLGKGAAK